MHRCRGLDRQVLPADIGYCLGRSAWNNGYATEGSRALLEAAFSRWGVDNVTAHALEANVASRRVLEKIGLRFAKIVRRPGERALGMDG